MTITLDRAWKKPAYTISRLLVDGVRFCEALEDTDRGLEKSMPLWKIRSIKVPGKTAIPKGVYGITLGIQSPKFRLRPWARFCDGYLPTVLGVPGFDRILIHVGNSAADTDGCILVGKNTAVGRLTQSTETFRKLYEKMKAADKRGEPLWLRVL